ncbi:hypothetical protein FRC02_008311 [Tulasnella sp. 418]|nr:hypothetical protein FRC02_008311 [Tulasnella sp. 418]
MKHGIAFRKLGRTSSHRMLMLRNLVSSLLEHQQIKTTLPKAEEAARLAEQMITLGKKGDLSAKRRAEAFLLNGTKTLPLLFGQYADRYREREGGYTRIHKFGHRQGDHAPHAILELVDNPRDIRFEMTARAVARETVQKWLSSKGEMAKDKSLIGDAIEDKPWIRDNTKDAYLSVVKFRGEEGRIQFEKKAIEWANHLLADAKANGGLLRKAELTEEAQKKVVGLTVPKTGRRHLAGERLIGMSDRASGLSIAGGSVGKGRSAVNVGGSKSSTTPRQRTWKSIFWEGGWKDSLDVWDSVGRR